MRSLQMLAMVFAALFLTNCKPQVDCCAPLLNRCDIPAFKAAMKLDNAVIIDTRSREEYEAGHIPDAVWFKEATATNTQSDDAEWCKDLLSLYPKDGNFKILVYAQGSDKNTYLPGRISRLYDEDRSRVFALMNGYNDWVKAGEEIETEPHILSLP